MDDTNYESATSEQAENLDIQSPASEVSAETTPVEAEQQTSVSAPKTTREALEAAFAKVAKMPQEGAGDEPAPIPDEAARPTVKAPQSWTPAAREKFSSLPLDVQQEVLKRETEINRKLGETAQERRIAHDFLSVITPFQQFFQQSGVHPMAATQELLTTAYTLRTGSNSQKAQLVAQLVKNFNIDFKELDNALEAAFGESGKPTIPPELDQRLSQVEQFTRQQQQYVAQAQTEQIMSHIEAFAKDPKNEFFADVAQDMQLLIQAGKANDLATAYEMAVWANPNTRKVLQQRQNQNQARLNAAGATLNNGGPRSLGDTKALKGKSTRDILDALIPKETSRF